LKGRSYSLAGLALDERDAIKRLKEFADQTPEWSAYRNFWMTEVDKLYTAKGLPRREMIETVVYRVGQDLGSRLGIAQGRMRQGDYRDELEQLIATKFQTRREFCDATGLSEDMLSHVLAKRKNLAIDTLAEALAKVGYTIHIVPVAS
jgi:hypothetical protein